MIFTAEHIRSEHERALRALTPEQRRAIERRARAAQQSAFNQRWPAENLQAIFEAEARERNAAAGTPQAA